MTFTNTTLILKKPLLLKHITMPTVTLFSFSGAYFAPSTLKILNLTSSLSKSIYISLNRWRNHSLSQLPRDIEWTDASFRHQFFFILSPFIFNLQTMDSCITLFNPQFCIKSIFLLGNEKKKTQTQKHYTERTVLNTKCTPLITKRNQRLKGDHCPFTELPDGTYSHNTHDYTFKQVIQIHSCRGKCVLSEPFGLNLTFPQATMDRASWYQRWNSSNANFMALSKHWERNDERNIRLYLFSSLHLLSRLLLGSGNNLLGPWRPRWFCFFNDIIYTSQLMGLAGVHGHFKRQPLCSSAYI